jgi:hypothetical protein
MAEAASARACWLDAIEHESSTTTRKSTLPLAGANVSHWYALASPNCATAEPPAVSLIVKSGAPL